MADWYVSSAVYATLSVWQASPHAYVVGDIIKRASGATQNNQYVFRCTTAGTSGASEPSWPTTNNGTVTNGGAVFTNVTGQSTYSWSAPAGTLLTICSTRPVVGDRVFLSSDHSESSSLATSYTFNASTEGFGSTQLISVNRAGSTPPVVSDIQNGAAITTTGASNITINGYCCLFWQGMTFTSGNHIGLNGSGAKAHYYKNCAFVINSSTNNLRIGSSTSPAKVTFDNTTVQFGMTSHSFGFLFASPFELVWINTPSAIVGATLPTTLFNNVANATMLVTCRGVDLSAITGTLVSGGTAAADTKVLLDSCKIASSVTRYGTPGAASTGYDEVELVNCYDGTSFISERNTSAGSVVSDFSTYLNFGAQDDIGNYSHRIVSSTRSDFAVLTLDSFWLDRENTITGSPKTATVEIISSAVLTNNDIKLKLEYQGTAGSPVMKFDESLASVLTPAAALPSSSVTWNNPPATPQKQKLQVTFTPQVAGRVRGLVQLGKVSTAVWVDPQITIT